MPLKLVTGPANSAKAGEVLGGYRERLDEEPVLVVPEFRDVEHAQREMAANGAVFGVRVLRFDRLWAEIARRVGYSARVVTPFQREQLIAQAVRDAGLTVLAASAQQPGFVRTASRFISELGRAGVSPDALGEALGEVGARRPAEGVRRGGRARLRRLPRRARGRGARRSRDLRVEHARRIPPRSRGLGRAARLRVRLRRLHRGPARRPRGARRAHRRHRVVSVRARTPGVRGAQRPIRPPRGCLRRARRARGRVRPLRGRLAHSAAPPRAGAVRSARRHDRRARGRSHAFGRRRARGGGAGRGLDPRSARERDPGGGDRGRLQAAARLRVTGRPGLRFVRDPVLARTTGRRSGTRRSGAGCSRCSGAPSRSCDGSADDLLTYLRTPRTARRGRLRRQARGRRAQGGRADRAPSARDLGRAAP